MIGPSKRSADSLEEQELGRCTAQPTSLGTLALVVLLASWVVPADHAAAQLGGESAFSEPAASWQQTQEDDFTRYELQAPASHSFRILYDVSATSPGTRLFFNAIRPGSEPTVHGVTDLSTGGALPWRLVDGATARADGWAQARAEMRYIRVELPRPVPRLALGERSISPPSGAVRLRIDKTYRDEQSYRMETETTGTDTSAGSARDRIVFERSLGIRRNEVVLPLGYELVSLNTPAQIATEEGGRVRLSFISSWPGPTNLELTAVHTGVATPVRPARGIGVAREEPVRGVGLPQRDGELVGAIRPSDGGERRVPGARLDYQFTARARQDREIVYELLDPKSHSFRLWHDYTETRPGTDRYLNVVRPGSKASDAEAWDLDSGRRLEVTTVRGAEITRRGIELPGPVGEETEVVVIAFEPVQRGGSRRLRIEETYTDPTRYGLTRTASGEVRLVWDRSFGRPRNAVVLPLGWRLRTSSIPATVSTLGDGRTRLDFTNAREDEIAVLLEAEQRAEEAQQ